VSDRQGYINLADCVNYYLDASEQSNHKFYKCWNLATHCFESLGLDAFFGVQTVKLPVLANKTVTLPANCLQWSKVGVFDARGQIVTLKRNTRLSSMGALHPDRLQKLAASGIDLSSDTFYNYWNGGTYTNLFGQPSTATHAGSFNVDERHGVIILNPNFSGTDIVLEFLPTPDYTEDLYVPLVFKEAIMWYLAWMDLAFMPNSRRGTLGDKEQRKAGYFNQRRLALARYKPFRANEAHDDNLDNTRKTIKG
jgi:hypothetical protein